MIQVPPDWARALDRLAADAWRRLVVLGARDVGKSTFCRLAAERLGAQVLDTDLGQKMFGPPACVTLGGLQAEAFACERLFFVGETNPALNIPGVVAGAARLAGAAEGRVVVNTSGLVGGPGLTLKRWKLSALDPEHVVAIAAGGELDGILAPLPPARVLHLRPSASAAAKRAGPRTASRKAALAAALAGGRRQPLGRLVVEELRREPPPTPTVRLCALADSAGEDVALGLVRVAEGGLEPWVYTAVEAGSMARLRLGMPAEDPAVSPLG